MDAQGYWNENDKAIDELVGKQKQAEKMYYQKLG